MRPKEELDNTDNRAVYRRRWKQLRAKCSYCPWHKAENIGRWPKHGVRKRNKTRRRGR